MDSFFFFYDAATTEIYTPSLRDAIPIWGAREALHRTRRGVDPRPPALVAPRRGHLRQTGQVERQALRRSEVPGVGVGQAGLDELGINETFEAWDVMPEDLSDRVATFRDKNFLAACVTLPHKQAVIPLVDELTEAAEAVGAVNWIFNRDGKLVGHNTDSTGFLRALREKAGFDAEGVDAIVFGAGGAARAIVYALKAAGVARLTIANRTVSKAQALASDFSEGRFKPVAIGLSRDEVIENLGTIAHPGTQQAVRDVEAEGSNAEHIAEPIGQFGVGLYPSFMVADRVELG